MTAETVLQVNHLVKDFPVRQRGTRRMLRAVDDITLTVKAGETVAVVGESGSGKSTLARCIARLIEPTSGSVTVGTTHVQELSRRDVRTVYSDLQMVFQDPNSSLNPRMTVRAILEEPLRLHTDLDADARMVAVRKALQDVDLDPALLDRYPRRLSGGQRQRIGIARALAVDPRVVLLDEPTASLDVSVRGRVLQLLRQVQRERQLGYVLISHDLQLVRAVADRVLVVYLGAMVEEGPAAQVFENPVHPYTRALMSAAPLPEIGPRPTRLRLIGEAPSPLQRPPGCRLAGRCPYAVETCHTTRPALLEVTPDHRAACPVVLA
jgi:oligopeptide/dipeptide ABC transporter ATP-binding protein